MRLYQSSLLGRRVRNAPSSQVHPGVAGGYKYLNAGILFKAPLFRLLSIIASSLFQSFVRGESLLLGRSAANVVLGSEDVAAVSRVAVHVVEHRQEHDQEEAL